MLSNPLFIASRLVAPAYVSYWPALYSYGFTEQMLLTTCVATTKKKRPVRFRDYGFRSVTIKPDKFFGYRRELMGDLPTIVADEAKAIVDSLDLPDYAGGLGEIAKALRAALQIVEVDALVQYANRIGDKSLGSRLGYLLETLCQPAERLIRSATPVKLDPSGSRSGETDRRWQVIVNIPERFGHAGPGDYLQHPILRLRYRRTQMLIFKGARLCARSTGGSFFPQSNRSSEDFDFNGPDDTSELKALWQNIVGGLEDFGIIAETRNAWDSDVGTNSDVRFEGPLHDARDHSKGKVRVDTNQRQEKIATYRELVTSPYDDVRPFVVTALALDRLLAEKLRALVVRGKPRDLYDIWLLLRQGVEPDLTLVEHKLALYDREWEREALEEVIEDLRAEWRRDLRPLLPQFVPYEVARERVEALFE